MEWVSSKQDSSPSVLAVLTIGISITYYIQAWNGIVSISTGKAYTVIVTSENAALFSVQVLRNLETLAICDPLPKLVSLFVQHQLMISCRPFRMGMKGWE